MTTTSESEIPTSCSTGKTRMDGFRWARRPGISKLTFHDIPNKALFLLLYLSPDKEIEYLRSTGTRNRSGSNSGKRPPGKPDTIRREKAFYVSRADSCRPESMKNAERLSLRKCKL